MTSRGARLTLIGIVTFIACAVAFAPASLVRHLLPTHAPVTLGSPTGTIWRGTADLGVAGRPVGRLEWSWVPTALLGGALGYDVAVRATHLDLSGDVTFTPREMRTVVAGELGMAMLADVLARYDLDIPGTLTIEHLEIATTYGSSVPSARGTLKWSGRDVAYRLGGRDHRVSLPPLSGFVDSPSGAPELTVYEADSDTPLMLARLSAEGLATFGITKQFTKLLGEPWPGGEPDHAVVLEVGEKLF